MKTANIFIFCLFICLIYFSCKDKITQPISKFEGITETQNSPEPTGIVDPDDWRPMMDCSSLLKMSQVSILDTVPPVQIDTSKLPTCTKIYPAYPNPASGSFIVQYSLNESDSVYITLNDTQTSVLREVVKQRQARGVHSVQIDVSNLSPAIYRVYIAVFRLTDVLHSYGDVKIVK